MSERCLTRTFAYACWLLRIVNDHCENMRVMKKQIFCDLTPFLTRSSPYNEISRECKYHVIAEMTVQASWNVMAHAQKPDFVFRPNGRVHLNRRGRFTRLLAAEVCASAVVMLDTACSEVVWRVLTTHSFRQLPLHLPYPCVTLCHHISTGVYHENSSVRIYGHSASIKVKQRAQMFHRISFWWVTWLRLTKCFKRKQTYCKN